MKKETENKIEAFLVVTTAGAKICTTKSGTGIVIHIEKKDPTPEDLKRYLRKGVEIVKEALIEV